jgi:hypothetical protein
MKRLLGGWPRLLEAALGVWLLFSPDIFGSATIVSERILGAAVIVFALLSFLPRFSWTQWLTGAVALWLGLVPYFTLERPGPPAAQNDITVAILLLMSFVLPTRATQPPASWQELTSRD